MAHTKPKPPKEPAEPTLRGKFARAGARIWRGLGVRGVRGLSPADVDQIIKQCAAGPNSAKELLKLSLNAQEFRRRFISCRELYDHYSLNVSELRKLGFTTRELYDAKNIPDREIQETHNP